MDQKQFNHYLDISTIAAKEAGSLLINSRVTLNKVNSSNGRDIKLEADIKAEKLIREILSDSNIKILGEEYGVSDDGDDNIMWVVDPLDGTSNYNRGIPISCVSIALVIDHNPVLGVIYDFNNNDMYSGGIYKKATQNDKVISVSSVDKISAGTLMTGLPLNTDYSSKGIKDFIEDFRSWKKIRMIGSAAMAAIYVASGRADCYKESGTNIWDVAAGVAISRAAGGDAYISNLKSDFSLDIKISNAKLGI